MLNGELKKKTAELEQTQVKVGTQVYCTLLVWSHSQVRVGTHILYTVSVVSFPGKGGDPYTVHC